MDQQQRQEIERRLADIAGKAWTERDTSHVSLLSDEIGLVLCFPERRTHVELSEAEVRAMETLWRKALDIEAGLEVVI